MKTRKLARIGKPPTVVVLPTTPSTNSSPFPTFFGVDFGHSRDIPRADILRAGRVLTAADTEALRSFTRNTTASSRFESRFDLVSRAAPVAATSGSITIQRVDLFTGITHVFSGHAGPNYGNGIDRGLMVNVLEEFLLRMARCRTSIETTDNRSINVYRLDTLIRVLYPVDYARFQSMEMRELMSILSRYFSLSIQEADNLFHRLNDDEGADFLVYRGLALLEIGWWGHF